MDGAYIIEQSECQKLIEQIMENIRRKKYYSALVKMQFLKENFTVEEVEGILKKTYFSSIDDFISGMLCCSICEDCGDNCGGGDCCTCIGCLIVSYITAKCIPGCDTLQEFCIDCAFCPCSVCVEECLPRGCDCIFDECCSECC